MYSGNSMNMASPPVMKNIMNKMYRYIRTSACFGLFIGYPPVGAGLGLVVLILISIPFCWTYAKYLS